MAGSVGRLSRFSTSASDALSRKAHMISLIANTALLIGKSYVYWKSQSMAILASLIDSAVDMVAQGVLMIANRIVTDRRDEQNVRYPAGRSKLESIGVVACALVMAMAAAQVIQSSVNELLGTERLLEVGVLDILIMGATTVIKLGLWIWCKAVHLKTGNVTVRAAGREKPSEGRGRVRQLQAAPAYAPQSGAAAARRLAAASCARLSTPARRARARAVRHRPSPPRRWRRWRRTT